MNHKLLTTVFLSLILLSCKNEREDIFLEESNDILREQILTLSESTRKLNNNEYYLDYITRIDSAFNHVITKVENGNIDSVYFFYKSIKNNFGGRSWDFKIDSSTTQISKNLIINRVLLGQKDLTERFYQMCLSNYFDFDLVRPFLVKQSDGTFVFVVAGANSSKPYSVVLSNGDTLTNYHKGHFPIITENFFINDTIKGIYSVPQEETWAKYPFELVKY